MPIQPNANQRARAQDAMSTAATADQLNNKSRAFGHTVARANLEKASAALNHAKQVASISRQATEASTTSK